MYYYFLVLFQQLVFVIGFRYICQFIQQQLLFFLHLQTINQNNFVEQEVVLRVQINSLEVVCLIILLVNIKHFFKRGQNYTYYTYSKSTYLIRLFVHIYIYAQNVICAECACFLYTESERIEIVIQKERYNCFIFLYTESECTEIVIQKEKYNCFIFELCNSTWHVQLSMVCMQYQHQCMVCVYHVWYVYIMFLSKDYRSEFQILDFLLQVLQTSH
eukprot:TRINITY_DN9536_c0_g1_i1.p1 TRINITY_DN9536_c0_g1~~TRINITY_DN9536_c0_g1_i1.p1  ORF type:complete len:216 (-),score=-31.34 TRINITY_DN9536_c0_g1_i1:130-777(-)